MMIDSYTGIGCFLVGNLFGEKVGITSGGYSSSKEEHIGNLERVDYFNNKLILQVGNRSFFLNVGNRREHDKLDLRGFKDENVGTFYYIASENHRENGGGLSIRTLN